MNYSFEYIDIILLAMIAGFIFLRLRGILGKKTGHEDEISSSFAHDFDFKKPTLKKEIYKFDEAAKKEFLKGAQLAYETIITSFASGKISEIKSLLNKEVYDNFNEALKERSLKSLKNETTFIGINSAEIKEHNQSNDLLEVSVNFISEIITCIKDKENKIVSGDPQKIKRVNDTWKFSRNIKSQNPNWQLIETEVQLKKISDKDKKTWKNFIDSKDKMPDKDQHISKANNSYKEKTIDLHGYTLDDANIKIEKFILSCFENNFTKINIITGKGTRSNNRQDPYQSKDLSILKHSVPSFIKENKNLREKILNIDFESVNSPSSGSFKIILKKKK